jgi:hypothetical protein
MNKNSFSKVTNLIYPKQCMLNNTGSGISLILICIHIPFCIFFIYLKIWAFSSHTPHYWIVEQDQDSTPQRNFWKWLLFELDLRFGFKNFKNYSFMAGPVALCCLMCLSSLCTPCSVTCILGIYGYGDLPLFGMFSRFSFVYTDLNCMFRRWFF